MFLIFILFTFIFCDDSCNKRTEIFKNHGSSNENGFYFIPETYLNSCEVTSNVSYYITILSNYSCNYAHCSNNKWENYNVMSIVTIEGCNLNIMSNYIMSYNLWDPEYEEKRIVFSNFYDTAYTNVYKCCKGKVPNNIPTLNCSMNQFILGCIIVGVFGGILVAIYAFTKYNERY